MRIRTLLFALTTLVTPQLTGCLEPLDGPVPADPGAGSGSATDSGSDATPSAYDQEILRLVTSYKSAPFSRVNSMSYTSDLGAFQINVYAYGDVTTYKSIHPESTTTATIGVGTVIVREVLDSSGAITALTAIAKAPAGYDSSLGDWWFGKTDATGTPMLEAGSMQVGRLVACHGCHVPREAEDYLFGVPAMMMHGGH